MKCLSKTLKLSSLLLGISASSSSFGSTMSTYCRLVRCLGIFDACFTTIQHPAGLLLRSLHFPSLSRNTSQRRLDSQLPANWFHWHHARVTRNFTLVSLKLSEDSEQSISVNVRLCTYMECGNTTI